MKRIPKLQLKPRHKCTTILIYQGKNEEVPWGRSWGCTNEGENHQKSNFDPHNFFF